MRELVDRLGKFEYFFDENYDKLFLKDSFGFSSLLFTKVS
jgi:hypothetical protein